MVAAVEQYALPPDRGAQAEIAGIRGDIAFYRGDYAHSKSLYESAATSNDGAGLAMRMANWSALMGEPDEALRQIERAKRLSRHPSSQAVSEMLVQQASVQIGAGQWAQASEALAQADHLFPGDWRIAVERAKIQALQGDLRGAASKLAQIATATGNPEVLDDAALMLRSLGKEEQAKALIDQAALGWAKRLEQLPEAAAGHALEHELHFGNPQRALFLAAANLKARPYGEAWLGLAEAWLANGRPEKALPVLDHLEYLVRLTALEQLGRTNEIPAEQAKALAINPHAMDMNPAVRLFDH
jgi:tetratricopeptide (TPR) repeat protein